MPQETIKKLNRLGRNDPTAPLFQEKDRAHPKLERFLNQMEGLNNDLGAGRKRVVIGRGRDNETYIVDVETGEQVP